jgi:hypothetical protein
LKYRLESEYAWSVEYSVHGRYHTGMRNPEGQAPEAAVGRIAGPRNYFLDDESSSCAARCALGGVVGSITRLVIDVPKPKIFPLVLFHEATKL